VKVCVTGATGFVGGHLIRALQRRADTITCLVRDLDRGAALGPDIRLVRGDLFDRAALAEACREAEIVYHVAGRISARSEAEFLVANRDGTANVLRAAAEAATSIHRFVYVSSIAAGGPSRPGSPVDETRAPAPVTPYGRSKTAAEAVVRAGAVPWTIVRPPVVYGERDRETLTLFRLARLGLGIVVGDGSQELSLVYAGDLADALIAAGTSATTAGRIYYAAHPNPTTSRALVLAVGRAVGRRPMVLTIPGTVARGVLWTIGSLAHFAGQATVLSVDKLPEFLAPAWTFTSQALARDAGWVAATDLETGLGRTAQWYREAGWL